MSVISLTQRVKQLEDGVSSNKRVAVYIVEDFLSSQFRYRCENILEAVEDSKNWTVCYFLKSELKHINNLVEKVNLVVIERQTEKGWSLVNFIKRMKRSGIKVIFDIDDLVFDYKDLGLLMESVQEKNKAYWSFYIWGIRRIAKQVDGFICTNDFLADKLKKSFGKPAKVIRNSLNKKQVEKSEEMIKNKKHDKFVVGYFSGSPTHTKDFSIIEPELLKLLESKDIKLKIVGYMKFSKQMQKMIDAGLVEFTEPVEYSKLQELISKVDVNIVPLVVNDFTNCKSELKFFEAAIVETTTIASPTYAFKKVISDGENGFLSRPGEWYDKLKYLQDNPSKNQSIAKKAREYVLKHFYGEEFLKEIEGVFDYFCF